MYANSFRPRRSESTEIRAGLPKFKDVMRSETIRLDRPSAEAASGFLERSSTRNIIRILMRRSISQTVHLINGFGNFKYLGSSGLDALGAHLSFESGKPYIAQRDSDSDKNADFHPWQSFAYCLMAGIDPDCAKIHGVSLRELAENSRHVILSSMRDQDLGHLLFAAASMFPDPDFHVYLDDKRVTLAEMAERGVRAHSRSSLDGSVCDAFHLTEGVCAASSISQLQRFRPDAEEFLHIQLGKLEDIGTEIVLMGQKADGYYPHFILCPDCFNEFIHTLGHAIELACFAMIFGYELTHAEKNMINFIINFLTGIGEETNLRNTRDSYLCHLRRSLTLWTDIDGSEQPNRVDLSKYTTDFSSLSSKPSRPLFKLEPNTEDYDRAVFIDLIK